MLNLVLQFQAWIPCDGGVTAWYSVDSGAILLGIKYRDSVPWSIDTRYSVPGTDHPYCGRRYMVKVARSIGGSAVFIGHYGCLIIRKCSREVWCPMICEM